jgi:hypothetical protein
VSDGIGDDAATTQLVVQAELTDGGKIHGADAVRVIAQRVRPFA